MAFGDSSSPAARFLPQFSGFWRWLKLAATAFQRDLRSSEPGQMLACALIGGLTGAIVSALRAIVNDLHRSDFLLRSGMQLSMGIGVDKFRILAVPAIGGVILGLLTLLARRHRMNDIVDPVEANALYGGRMSLRDSLWLAFTTVVSNASGASLGMEAGYSQLGAGLFSRIGQYFRLRRSDQRIFVTAGAGAAIAAAFNAPLAGAFYGYELILGNYTISALAPVAIASVSAVLVDRAFSHPADWFAIHGGMTLDTHSYFLFAVMGVLAAGLGILAMLMVTWAERILRRANTPDWMRPAIGGLVLSGVALYFPQVLGSGHGGIEYHFNVHWALWPLLLLLSAKLLASAVSVGSGFRGGLFSSSLFLGCLFGAVFGAIVIYFQPQMAGQRDAFMLVGMGSIAAAIVGAPLTMVFLVLESTGNFAVTIGVLVGVLIASTIVRLAFGYSFSTWRFHQRGIGIRGAHDVGWIADLTVSRLMRSDPKVVMADMTLEMLRKHYPIGSTKRVYVTDAAGRYLGVIDMAAVHDPAQDEGAGTRLVGTMVQEGDDYLLPGENVRTALQRFEQTETEVLPVLSSRSERGIIGYMTEQYALRRYTQELERRRSAELGERDLFSIGPTPER